MDIEKAVLYIGLLWYVYLWVRLHPIENIANNFYFFIDDFILKCNKFMYPDYWDDSESENSDTIFDINEKPKETPKYEDKYSDIIKQKNSDWIFTENEINEKEAEYFRYYYEQIKTIKLEIDEFNKEINSLNQEIEDDWDTVKCVEKCVDNGEILIDQTTFKDRTEFRNENIKELNKKICVLNNMINTEEGLNQIKNNAEQHAKLYIIDKKMDNLKNSYVIEKTPQGNVVMVYDKERETFKYYSDSTVPYKYLEVVARKYVKFFDCRPLFIDMDEELQLFQNKLIKEKELRESEEKLKEESIIKNDKSYEHNKSVFAKFKSYNKDAGGKSYMAAPPKNSIPNKTNSETKGSDKLLLKERANRYTYEGKISNFNFLKHVDKKIFNSRLGVKFSEFKKQKML